MTSQVAVLRTRPESVVADYGRLLRLAKYDQVLARDQDLILKLNLSWTKYFPACSSQPWQLHGVVKTLLDDGYDRRRIFPVENKTVVTDPVAGARNNKWLPVLERHGLPFIPLPEVEWTVYPFKTPLLRLNELFPEGVEIPKMYVGKSVLHAPTMKCVHPDTEILLADGSLVRAEALVKEWQVREPARDLPDGDRVAEGEVRVVSLGPDGLGAAPATHFWRTPVTDPHVWTVRTRTGRQLTTSARHPLLTPDGWKPASDLRAGDRIAIARHIRMDGESQTLPGVATLGHDKARAPERTSAEFWRWMGYFVAEGYGYDMSGSFRVSLTNTDPGIREDYIALCRSLFGVEPKLHGTELYFDALNLRPFFESLGFRIPTSAGNKVVPEILFRCPDREIAAFLQAYLDGDGNVSPIGVRATTKSRQLAGQIQMLCSRLGVLAFQGTIRSRASRQQQCAQYATISIYGDDAVTLARWIQPQCTRKRQRLDVFVRQGTVGQSRSRWDAISIRPGMFKRIRQGLGLTDIAWDRVVEVRQEGAEVPFFYDLSVEGGQCFIANGIVAHNTHGHTVTTGAIKNSFGGLLKEVRHYAHEFIHEVMVDLMLMQRELHPQSLAVMDGTVMGDGAGPRTMIPRDGNVILASADQVAIDAIAARIMGFDPLAIPYLRLCHERGLGVADPRRIELVGDVDAADVRMGFHTRRSLVIWGDQLIRRGPLRPLKRLLLHSPLVVWAPFASNVYHDWLWYPTIGRARLRAFAGTPWGRLFAAY